MILEKSEEDHDIIVKFIKGRNNVYTWHLIDDMCSLYSCTRYINDYKCAKYYK